MNVKSYSKKSTNLWCRKIKIQRVLDLRRSSVPTVHHDSAVSRNTPKSWESQIVYLLHINTLLWLRCLSFICIACRNTQLLADVIQYLIFPNTFPRKTFCNQKLFTFLKHVSTQTNVSYVAIFHFLSNKHGCFTFTSFTYCSGRRGEYFARKRERQLGNFVV